MGFLLSAVTLHRLYRVLGWHEGSVGIERVVRSPPILLRSYLWSTAQRRASANGGDALNVRGSILRVAVKVWATMLDNSTVGKRPEMSQCRHELIPPDTQYVAPQWKIRQK